jgi:UDP-N-acetylglucosamine pyrophosphorylase
MHFLVTKLFLIVVDCCIKEASDGNGGIYEAINKNGILADMKQKLTNVSNPHRKSQP